MALLHAALAERWPGAPASEPRERAAWQLLIWADVEQRLGGLPGAERALGLAAEVVRRFGRVDDPALLAQMEWARAIQRRAGTTRPAADGCRPLAGTGGGKVRGC